MTRRVLFLLCFITLALSACSKKEDVIISSADFGSVESIEESKEDKYAIEIEQQTLKNYTYETQSMDKQIEKLENENKNIIEKNQEKLKEDLGDIYVNENTEYQSNFDSISDNELVNSMRNQIFAGEIEPSAIDNLNNFINDNFLDMNSDEKKLIYDYIIYCWENYNNIQESLADLPDSEHWTEEELKENPDLRNYSRSEIEYIDNYMEQHFGKE